MVFYVRILHPTSFSSKARVKAWSKAGSSRRALVNELQYVNLCVAEVACESFWWSTSFSLIGTGFSKICASQLHRAGLKCIRDARNDDSFMTAQEAEVSFELKLKETAA